MCSNEIAKRRSDGSLGLIETAFIHQRADIAALSRMSLIHLAGIELGVGHDDQMMTGKIGITAAQEVVHVCDTPSHVIDDPIVADVQIVEGAILDSSLLGRAYATAEVLTPEHVAVVDGRDEAGQFNSRPRGKRFSGALRAVQQKNIIFATRSVSG